MNYMKIYEDLIEHRKMLPRLEGEYYERHHIVPRCMGGSDEPANLICLLAEDHFMAHLLLAKAYGGKLWFAANPMDMGLEGLRKIRHRRSFSIIRKSMSNLTPKTFINRKTGEIFTATIIQLRDCYGFSLPQASRLYRGGETKVSKGVSLESYIKPATNYIRGNPRNAEFRNIETGEIFIATANEMWVRCEMSKLIYHKLVIGARTEALGYCLSSTPTDKLEVRVNKYAHPVFSIEIPPIQFAHQPCAVSC